MITVVKTIKQGDMWPGRPLLEVTFEGGPVEIREKHARLGKSKSQRPGGWGRDEFTMF